MPDRASFSEDFFLDTTIDVTKTTAVQVPQWARYGMLYIPTCDSATVALEVALNEDVNYPDTATDLAADDDTVWNTLYDEAESAQVLGATTGDQWVDISNYVRALPKDCYIRVVFGATQNQSALQTLIASFRGA